MSGKRIAVALALTMVLTIGSIAMAGTVTPTKVLGGPGHHFLPATNGTHLAYEQTRRQNGDWTYNAYIRNLGNGHTVRLNSARKGGWAGSFDPGTNRVIFQEWNRNSSELLIYDADAHTRSKPGAVNSSRWEWSPLMSSTFITYFENRDPRRERRILLRIHNKASDVTRTIQTWVRRRNLQVLENSSLGEEYAGWTVCTSRGGCSAFLYNWDTRETSKIPSAENRNEYAPAIDELNGQVYFTRSRNGCGRSSDIYAQPIDLTGVATKIVDLPGGVDTGWRSSIFVNSGTNMTDLSFERIDCDGAPRTEIWVAPSVAPGM